MFDDLKFVRGALQLVAKKGLEKEIFHTFIFENKLLKLTGTTTKSQSAADLCTYFQV